MCLIKVNVLLRKLIHLLNKRIKHTKKVVVFLFIPLIKGMLIPKGDKGFSSTSKGIVLSLLIDVIDVGVVC